MEITTRENVVTAVCVVVAIVAFYAVGAYTELGDAVRYAILIGIGVIVPLAATG